ncbi:MAG: FAD-binding protein [Chloroflexota bacterium]
MAQNRRKPAVTAVPGRKTLLTGWGRTAPTRALLLSPESEEQIEAILNARPERGVIARGLGRSYGDPAQNAGGAVIDMNDLDRVLAFDSQRGTVRAEAGVSLDRLMRLFVPAGYFVPVTPGTRYVTIGGAIAADIHGKNHHLDGSFSNHVLDLELLLPTGERLHAYPGDDIFQATAGGMGLTGIILNATIQLIPIETGFVRVDTERAADLDDVMQKMEDGDAAYRYSVAWVDTIARGRSLGRSVLFRGNHATGSDVATFKEGQRRRFAPSPAPTMPDLIPGGLINAGTVRAFNEIWFRRHPVHVRDEIQSLSGYFHQLDMVENSNRMYGPGGFVQHQSVLPPGAEETLRAMIETLSSRRCPSFLVVLKRMGPGTGLLSFPMEGWTLAVDIPARWDGLAAMLDEFDDLVLKAGGRLYLAKDARMRPEDLAEMYPEIDVWREIVHEADPERVLQSDQARRLCLHGDGSSE